MRILGTETIAARKFLNLNETGYIDNKGVGRTWTWAQRPKNQNAVVIAATVDGNLVLIKEFRVPIGGYIYELPAGLIDPFESVQEAGEREFHEETGLTISKVLSVSPIVYSSPGLTDEGTYIIFAEATGKVSDTFHQASEDIEIMTYSRAAVQDLMHDPSVKIGARAYLVFREFVKYGKL